MMKEYTNNKRYSNLHLHQPFNKRIRLMKRESGVLHHFSFGEQFDETMMITYCFVYQSINLLNHQFIGFLPINKPVGKVAEMGITIHRLDGRMSDLLTGKEKYIVSAKRKRPLIIYRHFHRLLRNRKAIAYYGHFLHAVPCTAKNTPISQRVCTPLDTPTYSQQKQQVVL